MTVFTAIAPPGPVKLTTSPVPNVLPSTAPANVKRTLSKLPAADPENAEAVTFGPGATVGGGAGGGGAGGGGFGVPVPSSLPTLSRPPVLTFPASEATGSTDDFRAVITSWYVLVGFWPQYS